MWLGDGGPVTHAKNEWRDGGVGKTLAVEKASRGLIL